MEFKDLKKIQKNTNDFTKKYEEKIRNIKKEIFDKKEKFIEELNKYKKENNHIEIIYDRNPHKWETDYHKWYICFLNEDDLKHLHSKLKSFMDKNDFYRYSKESIIDSLCFGNKFITKDKTIFELLMEILRNKEKIELDVKDPQIEMICEMEACI